MEVRIQAAVRSDRGKIRRNNEDNFFFVGETMALSTMDEGARQAYESGDLPQIYAVCDGMGGEEAGEEASTLAVELLSEWEDASDFSNDSLQAFIEKASDRVFSLRGKTQGLRVGCTIVLACVEEYGIRVAHVGDSRAYRVSGGRITQWTRDHTEAERLVDIGVLDGAHDARKMHRNALTQHLGVMREEVLVTADISRLTPLMNEDIWILCSDGLSDMLSEEEIYQIVCAGGDARALCDRLVDAALEAGGRDNTTVIVLRVIGGHPAAKPEKKKVQKEGIKVTPSVMRTLLLTSFCVLLVCVSLLAGIHIGRDMQFSGWEDPQTMSASEGVEIAVSEPNRKDYTRYSSPFQNKEYPHDQDRLFAYDLLDFVLYSFLTRDDGGSFPRYTTAIPTRLLRFSCVYVQQIYVDALSAWKTPSY